MSSRNVVQDERVWSPIGNNGSQVQYGRYFGLTSSGTNQVTGQELAPHPYTLNITDQCSALYLSWTCSPYLDDKYVDYATEMPSCTLVRAWTAADDYALYGQLEEQYDKGGFNAGVFAGELGETADMLAGRARQLGRALKHAKKGNFAKAAQTLSRGASNDPKRIKGRKKALDTGKEQDPLRVSDGWLELQYGWLPMLSDIFSLADQISKLDKPRKRRIIAQKTIKYKVAESSLFERKGGGRYGKQIIAYITEDIPSWPAALGLKDPELIAWELVPFSFVADWFIPIGNYLQARAFAQRAKGTFVLTESRKWHARSGSAKLLCPTTYPGKHKNLTGLAWNRSVYVKRTVTTSLPSVPLPSFSNGLTGSGSRLANAAALIGSIFGPRNFFGR